MLVTTITHADCNDYLTDHFKAAFNWLRTTDLESLECGRHTIDGDDVYANVMTYETVPASEKSMEAHRNYYDVQMLVSGEEVMQYAQVDGLTVVQPYDESADFALYEAPEDATAVTLHPGDFAIVAPEDAHKPGCTLASPCQVKKVVVKVRK